MGLVISSASMSLDGFVARADDSVGALFDWYGAGDVEVPGHNPQLPPFRLTPRSADHWRRWVSAVGALVVGRRLFDLTDGWGGRHPIGVPVVVLSHRPAPVDWTPDGAQDFHFVADGIDAAIDAAQRIAGERTVGVAAGTIAGQALAAGRLDRVGIDLAPVLLGSGRRYFEGVDGEVTLGDPVEVIESARVTHLVYDVSA